MAVLEYSFEIRSVSAHDFADSNGQRARPQSTTIEREVDSSSSSNHDGILPMEHRRPLPYSRNTASSQDCENVNLPSSRTREMQFVANRLLDGLSHTGETDGGRCATSWYIYIGTFVYTLFTQVKMKKPRRFCFLLTLLKPVGVVRFSFSQSNAAVDIWCATIVDTCVVCVYCSLVYSSVLVVVGVGFPSFFILVTVAKNQFTCVLRVFSQKRNIKHRHLRRTPQSENFHLGGGVMGEMRITFGMKRGKMFSSEIKWGASSTSPLSLAWRERYLAVRGITSFTLQVFVFIESNRWAMGNIVEYSINWCGLCICLPTAPVRGRIHLIERWFNHNNITYYIHRQRVVSDKSVILRQIYSPYSFNKFYIYLFRSHFLKSLFIYREHQIQLVSWWSHSLPKNFVHIFNYNLSISQ